MPFARLRGIDLYWEKRGQGPRLLYLSGTGGDLRNHPNILDSPLVDRFQVLAFDQRGMGRTGDGAGQPSMEDYALDAVAVLDLAGWDTAAVMGVSFGGMVAQHLALLASQRLQGLVLMVTSPGGHGGSSYPLHELIRLPDPDRSRLLVEILDTRLAGEVGEPPPFPAWNPRQIEARRGHDTWERLPEIALPVLVVAGRHDGIAPPANGRRLAARIPGARFMEFDGGHRVLAEDPRALEEIAAFLGQVSGSSGREEI